MISKKRIIPILFILILNLFAIVPFPFKSAQAQEIPFTYLEYPTETWIIEKQDYFGHFLEWHFIPIEGQNGNKQVWNFTWQKRDYIEIYNETTGDPISFYENPIPSIKENLKNIDFLSLKYDELKDLAGFKSWGDFQSDIVKLDKYPIVPEDKEDFKGLHTSIDILNYDQGWFLVSFKDKWKPGKKITIGFGSTITYNGGTNTITVIGGTGGSPVDFWDVWNASNVNGWDVVHNNNETDYQYQFDCKIQIGDGSTETWFADTNKHILFNDPVSNDWQIILYVRNNANFRIGILENAMNKTTSNGCIILLDDGNQLNYIKTEAGSILEIYGSIIDSKAPVSLISNMRTGFKLYNSIFSFTQINNILAGDFHNLILQKSTRGLIEISGGNFNNILVTEMTWEAIKIGTGIFRGLKAYECTYLITLSSPTVFYLVDTETDNWNLNFGALATLYRQYTFNVLVVDKNGLPITDASIILRYTGQGGGIIGSWITPANGSMPELVLSKGFYNQTGGNVIYLYEPYTINVSASGYLWYDYAFNISDPVDLVVVLKSESDFGDWLGAMFAELDFPMIAIATALSIIVLLLSWLKHGDQ